MRLPVGCELARAADTEPVVPGLVVTTPVEQDAPVIGLNPEADVQPSGYVVVVPGFVETTEPEQTSLRRARVPANTFPVGAVMPSSAK
jgi:hypothetical protein